MTHSRIRDLYKADEIVVLTLFRTLIMQILHAAALPRDRWGYEAFVLTPMRQSEGFLFFGWLRDGAGRRQVHGHSVHAGGSAPSMIHFDSTASFMGKEQS